jgi:membrane-associated phospholipid phosphatase
MKMGERHTSRGLRQITEGLGVLDAEVFQAVANSSSPLLDTAMPTLTRAADHAKLWLAIAAGLAMSGSRSAHRGAVRGVVSLAMTSLITNQLAKRVWRRNRPGYRSVPPARRLRRYPTSDSLPSGHAASAAALWSASD